MEDDLGSEPSPAPSVEADGHADLPSEAPNNSDAQHNETGSPAEARNGHTDGNHVTSNGQGDRDDLNHDHDDDNDDDDDEDGSGEDSDDEPPVESLVAGRVRRNNAGNLMAKALAAEDDGDTDLLFAEEGEDEDFEAAPDQEAALADEDDSDDDSDDDEDNQAQDDLAGERELMKQERAEKRASTKRKGPGPQPLRKRVKIAGDADQDATQAPKRRLKKSERTSWLPSEGDAPTRVSSRKLAIENKVRTMESLKESTKRAAIVREKMKLSDARKKALERPPMTQDERLEEAARTEKLNLKSVKRWEQQESDRLARQRAELERLRNKKLEGPIIRWYSGPCEWDYKNRLHKIGRPRKPEKDAAIVEVQPAVVEEVRPPVNSAQENHSQAVSDVEAVQGDVSMPDVPPDETVIHTGISISEEATEKTSGAAVDGLGDAVQGPSAANTFESAPPTDVNPTNGSPTDVNPTNGSPTEVTKAEAATTADSPRDAPLPEPPTDETQPPLPTTSANLQEQPAEAASEHHESPVELIKEEPVPPAAPEPVADPAPALPQATTEQPSSSKEGATTDTSGLLEGTEKNASMAPEIPRPVATEGAAAVSTSLQGPPTSTPTQTNDQSQSSLADSQPPVKAATAPAPPKEPPPPPRAGQAQTLTLLSFDNAVLTRQPEAVRRIVLHSTIPNPASSTSRASNAIHLAALRPVQPLCAITSLPARYRDPLTGLAYRDREAFKVLRDTVDGCLYDETDTAAKQTDVRAPPERGRYGPRWSTLLGAWVGREGVSARNVPLGFVHGTKPLPLPPPPPPPTTAISTAVRLEAEGDGAAAATVTAKAE